jgi:hypothetical protein
MAWLPPHRRPLKIRRADWYAIYEAVRAAARLEARSAAILDRPGTRRLAASNRRRADRHLAVLALIGVFGEAACDRGIARARARALPKSALSEHEATAIIRDGWRPPPDPGAGRDDPAAAAREFIDHSTLRRRPRTRHRLEEFLRERGWTARDPGSPTVREAPHDGSDDGDPGDPAGPREIP